MEHLDGKLPKDEVSRSGNKRTHAFTPCLRSAWGQQIREQAYTHIHSLPTSSMRSADRGTNAHTHSLPAYVQHEVSRSGNKRTHAFTPCYIRLAWGQQIREYILLYRGADLALWRRHRRQGGFLGAKSLFFGALGNAHASAHARTD